MKRLASSRSLKEVVIINRVRAIGLFSALGGLLSLLSPAGVILYSQAEPVKSMKTIKTEESAYRTTVNIHNPTSNQVTIAAQVALARYLAGSDPGPFGITPFKEVVLQPEEPLE